MALKALTLDAVREYTSQYDPEKENPTVFLLGTLDSRVAGRLKDRFTTFSSEDMGGVSTVKIALNEIAFERVQFGLKGWKNWKDEQGNDLKFETVTTMVGHRQYHVVDPKLLAQLPLDVLLELSQEIEKTNAVLEADAKKSDTPS